MIYILAGADGTGKSTVFEGLKKMLPDAIFIKESYTPSGEEKDARVRRVRQLLRCGKTVVYDRATVLDDFIYEPVMHKQTSRLELYAMVLLDATTIIYFDCEPSVLEKRLESRGDEYVAASDIVPIQKQYEMFFRNVKNVCRIDASQSPGSVLKEVYTIVHKKSFKIAHIVPVGSLPKAMYTGYNMCLANIAIKNGDYAKHFKELVKNKQFVLMDNGAAEGDQLHIDDLIKCYQDVQPSEVVLPDTLCNGTDTIQKSKLALKEICEFYDGAVPFTFMAVPQGKTLEEWKECAEEMVRWPEIKAIGVSKFLPMHLKDNRARVSACFVLDDLFTKYRRYDIEVHLLGCSESPMTINSIHNLFPFVRGCDSAYAYICTQANVPIYDSTVRPTGEIDFIGGADFDKLEANMQALELAAGAYNNKVDKSWED